MKLEDVWNDQHEASELPIIVFFATPCHGILNTQPNVSLAAMRITSSST